MCLNSTVFLSTLSFVPSITLSLKIFFNFHFIFRKVIQLLVIITLTSVQKGTDHKYNFFFFNFTRKKKDFFIAATNIVGHRQTLEPLLNSSPRKQSNFSETNTAFYVKMPHLPTSMYKTKSILMGKKNCQVFPVCNASKGQTSSP